MERIAFVTGVSRGLGAALVDTLLAQHWQVVGIGRHDAPGVASPRYRFIGHDLADPRGVPAAVGTALADAARQAPAFAALVNNAAFAGPTGVFGRLAAADIAMSLDVNLAAPAALADAFCRAFAGSSTKRRIVNVSSGAAERPIAGAGMYCVAKAGLEMLTRMLAVEHAGNGFAAITLRPGIIDTGMQTYMRSQSAEVLPSVDLFRGFHASGDLVPAATVAQKLVARLLDAPVTSGRTYSYAEL